MKDRIEEYVVEQGTHFRLGLLGPSGLVHLAGSFRAELSFSWAEPNQPSSDTLSKKITKKLGKNYE